jgi:hypothetical protein
MEFVATAEVDIAEGMLEVEDAVEGANAVADVIVTITIMTQVQGAIHSKNGKILHRHNVKKFTDNENA